MGTTSKQKMNSIDVDSIQATNFEFDIEANRRRRAELSNDVTELLSISKFFLQQYGSTNPSENLQPMTKPTKDTTITKREKNEANVIKVRGRSSSRIAQTKEVPVANVTPTLVKRKQMRMNNERVYKQCVNDDDVPPLFDKIKLHQYCVDIVDRFFHGPLSNHSETTESVKYALPTSTTRRRPSTEKSMLTMANASANQLLFSKPKKSTKYASVTSRYMSPSPQKTINDNSGPKHETQNRLVSAKSREILEEIERKGAEIKRHSCLINKKERDIPYRELNHSTQLDRSRSQLRFSDIHPTIELVPSNSIFPKRILKQPNVSQVSSSAEINKFDEEKSQNIEEGSQTTVDSVIEVKNSDEKEFEQDMIEKPKLELKLQTFPVLSIKPQPKFEIQNVYEIDIKPSASISKDFFLKDKNGVIELVHESSEQDDDDEKDNIASLEQGKNPTNKYITPFSDEAQNSEKPLEETCTTGETHETSHLSLNLSTSSHLTDDEKSQSEKKITNSSSPTDFKRVQKNTAKKIIDKILEGDGIDESSEGIGSDKNEPGFSGKKLDSKSQDRANNFDDLREILRKIRNDKTTLDVALETIEPPDLMSPGRAMTDREVQCDDFSKIDLEPPKMDMFKNNDHVQESSTKNSPQIHSSLMESPKFNKTIESIRSSARRLDFGINDREYHTANREQIEKAAKKFLKSILKEADYNLPQIASEREDSSLIPLKFQKQKYQIVDDQIIPSNFNVKSYHEDCTSSSSSDATSLQLRIPSVRLNTKNSTEDINWIDRTDSDFTANSIEKYIKCHTLDEAFSHRSNLPHMKCEFNDLSDGEILSEGEFHIL